MKQTVLALWIATASGTGFAGGAILRVPEPGSFELISLAGVVAIVVAFRNRRK